MGASPLDATGGAACAGAFAVAVRSALDYTATWRAVLVVIIGWLVSMLIYMLLGVGMSA